jgi:hypothetical protein
MSIISVYKNFCEPVDFHTFFIANTDLNGQGWAQFSIYASSQIDD